MNKFVEIETWYQGHSRIEILNIDDIGRIAVGPNIIFLKTPYADGSNMTSVSSETIKKLMDILEIKRWDNEQT